LKKKFKKKNAEEKMQNETKEKLRPKQILKSKDSNFCLGGPGQ
jgi:hypothetical protein